jgi:hypothetical protein
VGSHSALASRGGSQGKRLTFQNWIILAKIYFPRKFISRQNLLPAKTWPTGDFSCHLHVAIGLQFHILNKHGGKEFPSNENYVILGGIFFLISSFGARIVDRNRVAISFSNVKVI